MTDTGVPQDTNYFISSSGKTISITFVTFDSQATAEAFLERIITKHTKRVLDRKPILNEKGVKIGERVVRVFEMGVRHEEANGVIRTDGPQLVEIDSDTLEAVLGMEKYRDSLRPSAHGR